MKKLLSMLLVSVLLFGVLSVTVSADNVMLRNRERCDLTLGADTYVTTVKDDNNIITGRTINATSSPTTTTLAGTTEGTFKFRPIEETSSGYNFGGASSQLKTNFIWQFDFSMGGSIPTEIDKCRILIGSSWKNKLYFVALDDTHYYIQWSSTGADCAYVNETQKSMLTSNYVLEEGKTYRLKIEANLDGGNAYVTFVNPYLDSDGNVKDEMGWDNAYTQTTMSKGDLGFTKTTVANITSTSDSSTRFALKIQDTRTSGDKITMTMSNETFYIERLFVDTPTVAVSGNSVTASTTAINIPQHNYYGYIPAVCCALYKDNMLAAYNMNAPYASGLAAMTAYDYSTSVDTSELEDGEYTLKTFVWNDFSKIMPYPRAYVTETITIADGVPTVVEDSE